MPPKWKVGPTPPASMSAAAAARSRRRSGTPDRTNTRCPAVNHQSESTSTSTQSVRDHLRRTDPGGGALGSGSNPASNRWNETLGAGWGGGFAQGATRVVNIPGGTWLVRYVSPGLNAMGSWWGPAPVSGDPRALFALPANNAASQMVKGQVKPGGVKALGGAGAPRCSGKPGGPYQVCLPYPAANHIDLVPGCLIAIRGESELLPQAEYAVKLAEAELAARKAGTPGIGLAREWAAMVKALRETVKQTKAGSAPGDWEVREKTVKPLLQVFDRGWDPRNDLVKLLYEVGNFYAYRNPVVMVSEVHEFEQGLDEALPLARKALQERKKGTAGPGLVEQLEAIVQYLQKVDACRKAKKYPSKRQRQAHVIGPMFADGWDPGDYLAALVRALDHFYFSTDAL